MSRINSERSTDRGQAYTLEGFISAMIVLMAILFAMQSVVITPTTGGLADRTVQSQIQQETQDALVIAATADEDEGNLSKLVRYWDEDGEDFYNPSESGSRGSYNGSANTEFYDEFVLGEILSDRFTDRGLSYNVELVYQEKDGEFDTENSTYLVYQGESEAVTASYTVTLFEADNLTASGNEDVPLREAYDDTDNDSYPIPPGTDEGDDSVVYNVVEVRVAVW